MIRFPWQRRADEAQHHRVLAQGRLSDAQADWTAVYATAAAFQRQQEVNGWTAIAATLFRGMKREGDSDAPG